MDFKKVRVEQETATSVLTRRRPLSYDGGRFHIETSPFICAANQWTGFYMITDSVMKELNSGKITHLYI